MKKVTGFILLLMALPMFSSAAEITFVIKGLKNTKGKVYVALYTNPETVFKVGSQAKICESNGALNGTDVDIICNLEPDTYAASAFHDENNNENFDTNFLGIPKEGYGFSNDASAVLSAPSFEDSSFTVDKVDRKMKINLKY